MTDLYTLFYNLKEALHLPEELNLRWIPDNRCKYQGCVSEDHKTIYIFNEDEERAKETLLHEVTELLITDFVLTGSNITRSKDLIDLREVIVESLRKLMSEEKVIKEGGQAEILRLLKEAGREDLIE